MADERYTFDADGMRRAIGAVRAVEGAPNFTATKGRRPGRVVLQSSDEQLVQITSLTPTSGFYPGQLYIYLASDDSFTAGATIWIREVNGVALLTGTNYHARRQGDWGPDADHTYPVFTLDVGGTAAGTVSFSGAKYDLITDGSTPTLSGSWQAMPYHAVSWDTDGYGTGGAGTWLTAPVSGHYMIGAQVTFTTVPQPGAGAIAAGLNVMMRVVQEFVATPVLQVTANLDNDSGSTSLFYSLNGTGMFFLLAGARIRVEVNYYDWATQGGPADGATPAAVSCNNTYGDCFWILRPASPQTTSVVTTTSTTTSTTTTGTTATTTTGTGTTTTTTATTTSTTSTTTTPAGGRIIGHVLDGGGNAVVGWVVNANNGHGGIFGTSTDGTGYFEIDCPPDTYTVSPDPTCIPSSASAIVPPGGTVDVGIFVKQ